MRSRLLLLIETVVALGLLVAATPAGAQGPADPPATDTRGDSDAAAPGSGTAPSSDASASETETSPPAAPTPGSEASPSGGAEPATGQSTTVPVAAPVPRSEPETKPQASQPTAAKPQATPLAAAPKTTRRLRTSLGGREEDIDMGAEADTLRTVGAGGEDGGGGVQWRAAKWTYNLRAFVRMPFRVGWGPRGDDQPGTEMHIPRLVGNSTTEWTFINLPRGPNNGFVLTAGTENVGVTFSLTGSNTTTSGAWYELISMPDFAAGYLWIKAPEAFGSHGGLTFKAGEMGVKYGLAGPGWTSAGYYGTYLFGRISGPGAVVTADLDLTDKWGLMIEAGGMTLPAESRHQGWYTKSLPLPSTTPDSSKYVLHGHAMVDLRPDKKKSVVRFGAHFIENWASNDEATATTRNADIPRLRIYGGDIHLNQRDVGDGYIGFSRVEGENLDKSLSGVELIHQRGSELREFWSSPDRYVPNPSGTLHNVLFQHTYSFSSLAEKGSYLDKHKLALALYGMYSHGWSDPPKGTENYPGRPFREGDRKMLKFGTDAQFGLFDWLQVNLQFDHVRLDLRRNATIFFPDPADPNDIGSFSAISPRLILRQSRRSAGYVVVGYTHFFIGSGVEPISPQNRINPRADTDLFAVCAYMKI